MLRWDEGEVDEGWRLISIQLQHACHPQDLKTHQVSGPAEQRDDDGDGVG